MTLSASSSRASSSLPLALDRMLSKGAATPIYLQVYQGLARLIENGTLERGSALPGERDLALQIGVSRVTVRQALRLLTEGGQLVRKQGSGTFVAESRILQPLSALSSFSDDMRSRGLQPGARVLSLERTRPSPQEAMNLALKPSSEVWRLKRLRTADGQPLAIEISSVPLETLPQVSRAALERGSLYALLKEGGHAPVRAMQHLRATAADAETARLLELSVGAPLLSTERVTWDALGKTLEYARSQYRGDRYDFLVELSEG